MYLEINGKPITTTLNSLSSTKSKLLEMKEICNKELTSRIALAKSNANGSSSKRKRPTDVIVEENDDEDEDEDDESDQDLE